MNFEEKLAKHSDVILTEKYKNAAHPHQFKCAQGHIFTEQPGRLLTYAKRGHELCTVCKKVARDKKFAGEYMKRLRAHGLRCSGYKDISTKAKHRCEEGHVFYSTPASVINTGFTCRMCLTPLMKDRLKAFESAARVLNYEVVTSKRKLNAGKQATTVLATVRCNNCGEEKEKSIARKLARCACAKAQEKFIKVEAKAYAKTGVRKTASLEERAKAFAQTLQRKYPHLSCKSTYAGSGAEIKMKCSCGNRWTTKPQNILASKLGCPKCGIEQARVKRTITEKDYAEECIVATLGKLRLVGEYRNDSTKAKHECVLCGNLIFATPNYVKFGRKRCPCWGKTNSSAYSNTALHWLSAMSAAEAGKIRHAGNQGEKRIKLGGTTVSVDGYCSESKTIYEYLGDCWHGDVYSTNKVSHPHKTKTNEQLLAETFTRFSSLAAAGYTVKYVWESDFKRGILLSGEILAHSL